MIYVWARKNDTQYKIIGAYEYSCSPCDLLFRHGENIDIERLSRCLLYVQSHPFNLPDDLFLRMELRPNFTPAYVFIDNEIFYFDCMMLNKINISVKEIASLKLQLNLTIKDIDQPPKKLTDHELALITQYTAHYFSRTPMVTFSVKSEKLVKFDCLATNICAPLVNERTKELLEKIAPNDVQFFPAKLICKDGELGGYYFVNVTSAFVGLDYEKSIYTQSRIGHGFLNFKYVTYKPGCMGEHLIARDKEQLGHLLVSETLKNVFEKEKITGVDFIPPEIYYRPLTAEDLIAEEQAILREKEEGDE